MKLFADDTSLYCIVDDQNETAESLNSDLNSLSTWASDWCCLLENMMLIFPLYI